MKRSGNYRESVLKPVLTGPETILNEDEHEHIVSDNEDPSCTEKARLTREERLAIWKAQKQANKQVKTSASGKSKHGPSDHHLKVLTSSQLNSCSGSFLASASNPNILSTVHHPKRHCSTSSTRRESQVSHRPNPDHSDSVTTINIDSPRGVAPLAAEFPIQESKFLVQVGPSTSQTPVNEAEANRVVAWSLHQGHEDPSPEVLKQQLFDQNNRLNQCAILLQRMLDENQDLHARLNDYHLLQERCARLENTMAEVSLLYQVSQMTSSGATDSLEVQCSAVRTKLLEDSSISKDREISRLRGRLSTMESEFKGERERLVGKLLTADEGRRAAEAACKENDAMWEQLFNSKISELQAKCADALQMRSMQMSGSCGDKAVGEEQAAEPAEECSEADAYGCRVLRSESEACSAEQDGKACEMQANTDAADEQGTSSGRR